MSSATTTSIENASATPEVNPWLIGVVVSLAAFMEVLDASIANVALPHIAGNLGASNDESTWVLTSYLVSNAIVLPISGFLVGLLGRKRFFLICIAFFTVSSFLCGLAPSLGLLLLFRVLQGAFGGGLQPMTQAILADTFPPEKRGFQARHLLAFGWITLALGMYATCKRIDLLISFGGATWLRILQYLPVGFLFVPLTMTGYVGVPKEKTNAAAGLMNFMRNIGQSVGTSAVTRLIARRSQYHQSVLASYTRSPQFNAAVAEVTTRLSHAGFDLYSAQQAALAKMYDALNTQAQALSYVNVYWLLAVTAALMFLLCFLLEKNQPGASGKIQVH